MSGPDSEGLSHTRTPPHTPLCTLVCVITVSNQKFLIYKIQDFNVDNSDSGQFTIRSMEGCLIHIVGTRPEINS